MDIQRRLGLRFWIVTGLLGVGLVGAGVAAEKVEVLSFSPEGTIKEVRQVRASFSDQMVAFGDPRATVRPFDIRCPEPGKERWADTKNWIYDFDRDIPPGIACEFKLKAGIKSLGGQELTGKREFVFSTGGPSIKRVHPYDGARIDEDQAFLLEPDAPVDEKTVGTHVYFEVEGVSERIPVRVIKGSDREKVLKAEIGRRYRYSDSDDSDEEDGALSGRALKQKEREARAILIQATRNFPPKAKVKLVWGKGIAAGTPLPPAAPKAQAKEAPKQGKLETIKNWFSSWVPGSKSGSGSLVETTEDQTFSYEVRGEFRAEFSCDRENAQAACIPFSQMSVSFSGDIPWAQAKKIVVKSRDGKVWKAGNDKSGKIADDQGVSSVYFAGPFPEKSTFKIELPKGIKDDSGRKLTNADMFPLETSTAPFPPLAKFPATFGILELKPEAVLPVTLRSLEPEVKAALGLPKDSADGTESVEGKSLKLTGAKLESIVGWMLKVSKQDSLEDRDKPILMGSGTSDGMRAEGFTIKKPNGGKAFEVIGIPLKKPGFYVVEIESHLLGKGLLGANRPMYVSTAALVTDLSVHFKRGRESSLAWVTSLSEGKPVASAQVAVRDCHGKILAKGKTDDSGVAHFPELPGHIADCSVKGSYSAYYHGIFVTAEKGDDFSFVHSSWDRGLERWRFNLRYENYPGPNIAHTVFDRTMLRAGETVHMKHFVRRHVMSGFGPIPRDKLPEAVRISHRGTDQKFEFPLKWESGDVAESTWVIPKGANLGYYDVALLTGGKPGHAWESGEFRVEEFRVPLMKGTIRPPSEKQVSPSKIPLDVSVAYLAGGGASGAPVQVRYQQQKVPSESFAEFEDFIFANGAVRDSGKEREDEQDARKGKVRKVSLNLDHAGTSSVTLEGIQKLDVQSTVLAEMEFKDPNGEIQTVSSRIPVYPAKRLVGLKLDSWFSSAKSFKFHIAVADLSGKPVVGTPVEAQLFEQRHVSHRKRLIGGFYAYENRAELKKLSKACSGTTDSHGLLICDMQPGISGNLLIQAQAKDDAGNTSYANTSAWVYGDGDSWFPQEDHDRMDLLPARKRYEPGEKAEFQVRMPFSEAQALVTVEREGILDSFVVPVSRQKPTIEVPIKPNYGPNIYVSVLAVRGRVGDVQPTALVDLGRPAYKLGITEIDVGWGAHELKVKVDSDKETYRIRQKAKVKIHVSPTQAGGSLPAGTEVLVAAVDEGLLLLKANDSWKLLEAMMKPRGYEIETMTAQMQVVGKRHFGLKALPNGGDGGKSSARELFETLLYWKARVPVDEKGDAAVEVPLNDSITSFRIVAVASGGMGSFGFGSTSIRATQDLMMFSGVPPLVREGDRLPAEFTLRNATTHPMQVELTGKISGMPELKKQVLEIPAGESKVASWMVEVPTGVSSLAYEVTAVPQGGASGEPGEKAEAGDKIKITQKVIPAVPVKTYQATLSQIEGSYNLKVEFPKGAIAGKGGVRMNVQPTVLTGLAGVTEYMKAYPYSCLEQRTSKAIALRDQTLWKQMLDDLPSYLDRDGLAKYFPCDCLQGSDVLTSYLLAIAQESGRDIPQGLLEKMTAGLGKFVRGEITRGGALPTADLTIRKVAAIEALSRYGVARADMLSSLEIAPNLWPTSAVIDWFDILKRIKDIPGQEEKLKQADQILRSRLNFQGTVMSFSTQNMDELWWLMISTDVNANRLVLSMLDQPGWKSDMARIVRGALARQSRGHWLTTTGNAWGVLAMEKFARAFEAEAVGGLTVAKLDAQSSQVNWNADPAGKILNFEWPKGNQELSVKHEGPGKPWATVQSLAAIPLKEPFSSGYRIKKTWSPVEQKKKGDWSRGDVIRVRLELEAQSDMTWVVVNDPIPAGASILGSGLGSDSSLLTQKEKRQGWVWTAYEERAFDAFRSYYEFVPKGKWTVEYTIRLNQSGAMNLPATRVEALYSPEMLGEAPNAPVKIGE